MCCSADREQRQQDRSINDSTKSVKEQFSENRMAKQSLDPAWMTAVDKRPTFNSEARCVRPVA